VLAIYDPTGHAPQLAHRGLAALQHRGQEAAGLITVDAKGELHALRGRGLVSQVLPVERIAALSGMLALGHVRYSTVPEDHPENLQPLLGLTPYGALAIAHNGNLKNARSLTESLTSAGAVLATTMDTELFLHLLARSGESTFVQALRRAAEAVIGAYSLALFSDGKLYGLRDPFGLRPLVLGQIPGSPSGWVIASESCALQAISAQLIGEIARGELVEIGPQGVHRQQLLPPSPQPAPCVFELVYFARPDSVVFGQSVQKARLEMGRELARQDADLPTPDLVIPVPDSGVAAAVGYSHQSGIPFDMAILRSHYVGRSFLLPSQQERCQALASKLSVISESVTGKRVVLVDDSLVRGNTARLIVQRVRERGAKEVWLRLASPPIAWPCYLGIDMTTEEELLYRRCQVQAEQSSLSPTALELLRIEIGADSLRYLTMEGLRRATHNSSFCFGCMNGEYPL
jgi:amidophosphoribosyltransferase